MKLLFVLGVAIMTLITGASRAMANSKDLSQNAWPITPVKAQTAVIFIEFQKEWVTEEGLLYQNLVTDKAELRKAVGQAEKVLGAARKNNWHIVHAGLDMRNDPTYQIFAGGKNVLGLRAGIPAAGTWTGSGAEFVAPFIPKQNEFVVAGRAGASIFTGSNLESYLRNNKIDTLIMMGFATHVCVESSVREAHDAGYNAYVVTDASAAFNKEQDEYFAKNIIHHFGYDVGTNQLVEFLSR